MSRIEAILQYQEADLERQQIENDVRSTEARQRMNKLSRQLKNHQATSKKLTDDMESYAAQIRKLQAQQEAIVKRFELESSEMDTLNGDEECTSEEWTEFRRDVEKLNKEALALDKELHALLQAMDRALSEYQKNHQEAVKAKREYNQVKEICIRERDEAAKELLICDKKLEVLADKVDPALLKRYQRVRQHHNMPMVTVRQGKCSGCNMGLPVLAIERLSAEDAILECENCGRLLYVPQP